MSDLSGEELWFVRSWSQQAESAGSTNIAPEAYNSRTDTQALKPRLTTNDILALSDHPLDSIVHVSRGSGYTQFAGLPFPVRCTWPMLRSVYQLRRSAPWPAVAESEPETVVVSDKSPSEIEHAARRAQEELLTRQLTEALADRT